MTFETTRPEEAQQRLASGDWMFLDVRSTPEFEAGHVPGAFNVPLLHLTAGGMEPNDEFLAIVRRHFEPTSRLVVGCRVGGRSARACELLAAAGFAHLANLGGGFAGRYDAAGRMVEPGWIDHGLPVAHTPQPGRSYVELRAAPEPKV